MQFYTSACSMVVQVPVAYLMVDVDTVYSTMDWTMFISLLLNGIFFHGQTITAYSLMGYISPVTHRSELGGWYSVYCADVLRLVISLLCKTHN